MNTSANIPDTDTRSAQVNAQEEMSGAIVAGFGSDSPRVREQVESMLRGVDEAIAKNVNHENAKSAAKKVPAEWLNVSFGDASGFTNRVAAHQNRSSGRGMG